MQNAPGKQCRSESSTVEELILAHAVASTDQQLVCTMAMVCKDWNMAVQHQTPAGGLHVTLQLCEWQPRADALPSSSMEKLGSFSKWLPKHARLVSKLDVKGLRPFTNTDSAWFTTLAAPLFSSTLQGAALATAAEVAAKAAAEAAAAGAAAAAKAAAAAAAAEASQVQPLGIQSYSSDIFYDNTVLQALPATSLTHLDILCSSAAAVAAALPRLSNLQQLNIAGRPLGITSHSSVCAAASQVCTLTSLYLGRVTAEDVTQLPVQLSRLKLRLLDNGPVDFFHLTRLSSLNISFDVSPSSGQVLPTGLIELVIEGDSGLLGDPSVFVQSNLSQLQSLESLAILSSRERPEELHQLGALPALRKLSLGYTHTKEANAASAAWASLWQLKEFVFNDNVISTDFVELFDKLSSVTQLTRLAMVFHIWLSIDQENIVYGVGRQIARLHQLRDLTIQVADEPFVSEGQLAWAQGDVKHLSTLSQLTKLDLSIDGFAQEVIDDLSIIVLLLKLKQLQELRVPVKGLAVFPVIADLSNLRTLELYDVPDEVQQTGLQELHGLKMLTELEGFGACSKEALADFWNAVRS